MNRRRKLSAAVALWASVAVSAQADDLLDNLSAPPRGFSDVVSVGENQTPDTIEQISFSLSEAAGPCGAAAKCCQSDRQCCTKAGACGGTSGNGCGCDGSTGWLSGATSGDGLLDGVFAVPENLLGINLKGDHCFDNFIEPVTNSVFFEDPRSRTRLRFLFINQTIPESTPVLAGGDFQVYGMQATFALNERLAIIAQKDGWINLQADGIPHQDGWANLATGLKYVLIRDVENQFIVSTGFQFEWTNGSSEVFQGGGQNIWSPFLTVGKEMNCNTHFVGTIGGHWAADSDQSNSFYYSLHLDHEIMDNIYAFGELNGIHFTEDGDTFPLPLEGGDLINLGSTQASGLYRVSAAVGAAAKIGRNWEAAAAWEVPLADRGDFMDDRLTVTLSYTY